MSTHQKMKLTDLTPQAPDPIDWNSLDAFFTQDAPTQLSFSLGVIKIVKQPQVLEHVDNAMVLDYANRIATDTMSLNAELVTMYEDYKIKKERYKGNYDENAHMYSLTVAHSMTEWLDRYENTVQVSLGDLIDYVNQHLPAEQKI